MAPDPMVSFYFKIAPVSAAAMERAGNYQSCYHNIVRHQILDEIESLFDLKIEKGGEGIAKQLEVGKFHHLLLTLIQAIIARSQSQLPIEGQGNRISLA